jgi:hypothetical protein
MRIMGLGCVLGSSCTLDEDPEGQLSRVTYRLDGTQARVEEGLAIAIIDESKGMLGPNTHVYFEASLTSTRPDRIVGDKLRINLPPTLGVGQHHVKYSVLPSASAPWVSYRRSSEEIWTAFEGSITVEEVGGVGERLRVTFGDLRLGNSCGEVRTISDGEIDVRIGSEESFPESEIEYGPGSEWAAEDVSTMIENNVLLEFDEKVFACFAADFMPAQQETLLDLIVFCSCDYDPADGSARPHFGLVADIPAAGQGRVVANGAEHFFGLFVDSGTPLESEDDDLYYALEPAHLDYFSVGSAVDTPIDISLASPLTLTFIDRSGSSYQPTPSRTKQLRSMRAYGFVNRERE